MVQVPTGGRKKKLKHANARTEATVASAMPHPVAMNRIETR